MDKDTKKSIKFNKKFKQKKIFIKNNFFNIEKEIMEKLVADKKNANQLIALDPFFEVEKADKFKFWISNFSNFREDIFERVKNNMGIENLEGFL